MFYSPEAIIEGLLKQDQAVLRYLYKRYAAMIAGHIRKNNGSEQDVQEMIQTTMLDLWLAVRDGRYQEQGKLDQYIFQLAANSWREELRRRRNRPQSSLDDGLANMLHDDSEESLSMHLVKDKYLQAVHEGIQELGEPCQEIIKWYHLEKVSLLDIAERLQYDYNNLRKRIFDCRKKLKTIVEQKV